MKRIVIVLPLILLFSVCSSAQYFQQKVDYDIEVQLDTAAKTLTGEMTIHYTNRSNQALDKIYLHLWTNAYNSQNSDFSKQNLASNDDKFYWADEEKMGGYRQVLFSQNGQELNWSAYNNNPEYAELILPQSIEPNSTQSITVQFEEKIPYIYSRGGWAKDFFGLTQWFPKVAVYDQEGWHRMPYLEMGEYYSEYGDYKVSIETPDSSVLGATGIMTDSIHLGEGRVKRTYEAQQVLDFAWFYSPTLRVWRSQTQLNNGDTVDLFYYAPKNYSLNRFQVADTLIPQTNDQINNNLNPLQMMERAVQYYSEEVAPYPYPQASVVIGPLNTGGGMEYPMITLIAPMPNAKALDLVITHEIGHNWFQSILGFNERRSPYLDEGINSFYENKYMDQYYPTEKNAMQIMAARTQLDQDQFLYQIAYKRGDAQPVNSHTHDMSMIQYYFNGYMVPPSLYKKLEEVVGPALFKETMQTFYEKYKFQHPSVDNLQSTFEEKNLKVDWFFRDILTTLKPYDIGIESVEERGNNYRITLKNAGEIKAPAVLKVYDGPKLVHEINVPTFQSTTTVEVPFDDYDYFAVDQHLVIEQTPHDNVHYFIPQREQKFLNPVLGLNNPGVKKVWWYPIFNYNKPSGGIFGVGLHNITLPGNPLEFYLNPGFSLQSQTLVGLAGMDYYITKNNSNLRYINLGWSAKRYTFDYNENHDYFLNYLRINPRITIAYQARDYFNPWYKKLTLEMPMVQYESPEFSIEGDYVRNKSEWRMVPRLHFSLEKKSPVNSVKINLMAEYQSYQGFETQQQYLKTTAEIKTDYAYAAKKKFYARFFLGAFPLNDARSSGSVASIYAQGTLGMFSQAYHDYAFDGYFFDRSGRNTGLLSRQIRQNDGGFKDALGSSYALVTGNSNSFLASANLGFDLPFLPPKIPISPYFDLGIYDDATPVGEGFEFLFSGGIMLGKNHWPIQVYLPLVSSEQISNIHKERGNIWKRISFKMDLENFGLSKKARDTRLEDLNILN